MLQKRVSALASAINAARLVRGGSETITHITNDSRDVTRGSLYAALPGEHVDGHSFIHEAIRAGAVAILCERVPANTGDSVAVFQSDEPRLALSEISDVFFDSPSRKLDVIGVTGTDGKTSTVYFIHQLLAGLGENSAFLSTAAADIDGTEKANLRHQSTPEAPLVHQALHEMQSAGNRYAVIESTSHGLSRKTCRLAHVCYRAAVFTNIDHEHLEFHGSFGQYRDDKANLFRALETGCYACSPDHNRQRAGAFGVVNLDAPDNDYFATQTGCPVFGYGITARSGEIRAEGVEASATSTRFSLTAEGRSYPVVLPVPGPFNVENMLAAVVTVAKITGASYQILAGLCGSVRQVRGRMSVVSEKPFAVVVDYAHTPGSFRRILPFFRGQTSGRLIVVFGSAGERDVAKRPLQGSIADQYADIVVLADEDPRGEPRMKILDEIAEGCPTRTPGSDLFKIPNRREAIRHALEVARPGDTVLLLGKGHESSIIGRDGVEPWDEEAVARSELRQIRL